MFLGLLLALEAVYKLVMVIYLTTLQHCMLLATKGCRILINFSLCRGSHTECDGLCYRFHPSMEIGDSELVGGMMECRQSLIPNQVNPDAIRDDSHDPRALQSR